MLFDYQKKAVEEIIKRKRVLLWYGVGTGKTAIALKVAEHLKVRTLYVCPSILKRQIEKEIKKFTPSLKVVVCEGTNQERRIELEKQADIYIVNYEMFLSLAESLKRLDPQFVILDECQKICGPTNKTTKRIKKLINPLYRLAMSGTPCPNALWELWSIADFLYPRAYGENFYQWRAENCKMNPYYPKIEGYYNEEEIRRQFNLFTLRLRREDVLKLPSLHEKRLEIRMDNEHYRVYNLLKSQLVLELSEMEKIIVPNILALILRLRQIVDCPRVLGLDLVSEKEKALDDILDITAPQKVIVFFEHSQVLKKINEKFDALVISGEIPNNLRHQILADFREKNDRLLFMTQAGAEGINLEFCKVVVHYQQAWNDARMEQRTGRIYRYGQTEDCVSYRLIVKDSIDERLEKIIARKKKLNKEDLCILLRK